MSQPNSAGLSPEWEEHIDHTCDRFDALWQAGQRPVVEDFLSGCAAQALPELLRQLLLIDLECRRKIGETPTRDDYRGRFAGHEAVLDALFAAGPYSLGPANRTAPHAGQTASDTPSPQVPGYEILGKLGRGGMGVVYKARHLALDRVVALKMIRSAELASVRERERFRAEAQAVAHLQHPNVVAVHEVGEHQRLPYFSLELCEGGNLAQRLKASPLAPREAAALVETLARALAHAHERGIVHRDLKPANVLRTADGTWKVTDFGLAKRLGATAHTQSGAFLGTPAYAAPEQARGHNREVGPAVDVYALGVLLYECLTGRPPFNDPDPMETLLQAIEAEPLSPRALQPKVPRDLETICLQCLAKEPGKRFASALEMAEDLGRFQRGEPIKARPVGRLERAGKWVRRNPVVAALTAAVVAALLLGACVATVFGVHANANAVLANQKAGDAQREADRAEGESHRASISAQKARQEAGRADREAREAKRLAKEAKENEKAAKAAANRAEIGRHGFQMTAIWQASQQHDLVTAEALLEDVPPAFEQTWEYRHLRSLCRRMALTLKGHPNPVYSVGYSPDGRRIVSGSGRLFPKTGEVKVWDAATGQNLLNLKGHTGYVRSVGYSPDGRRIVSGSGGWHPKTGKELPGEVKVWDAATGQNLLNLKGHTDRVFSVGHSPDGRRIVSGSGGWHPKTGKDLPGEVKVWDAATGQNLLTLKGHTGPVSSVGHSPDGRRIVSGSFDKTVKVWNAATGQNLLTLKGHAGSVLSVGYSPDGRRIISGSGGLNPKTGKELPGEVKVWDAATGQNLLTLKGHTGEVMSVGYSPDGRRIVSGSRDKTVKAWDAATGQDLLSLKGHTARVLSVCYSPDGRRIVSGSGDRTVKVWDAATGQNLLSLKGHTSSTYSVGFSPDGRRIVSGSHDGTLKVWDAATGQNLLSLKGHTGIVFSVAFSPDGRRIVSGSDDNTVKVWEAATGQNLLTLKGHTSTVSSVGYSPDGRRIVSGSHDRTVKVWDAATGQDLLSLKGHVGPVWSVGHSPDGRQIVSGSFDKTVKVWDAATGQNLLTLKGHTGYVRSVGYSPDGRQIVSGDESGTLKVWDADAAHDLLWLKGHTNTVTSVAFSPDGKQVFGRDTRGRVLAWDAVTGHRLLGPPANIPAGRASAVHANRRAVADGYLVRLERVLTAEEQKRLRLEEERRQSLLQTRISREFHAAEAETAEANDRPFATVFHLDRLITLLPAERPHLLARRSAALIAALKQTPNDTWATRTLARQAVSDPGSIPGRDRILPVLLATLAKQQGASCDHLYGAVLLRTGAANEAILVLRAALRTRTSEGPPVEELLLARAYIQLKDFTQARRHLQMATAWMQRGSESIRIAALAGLVVRGPLAGLGSLAVISPGPLDHQTAHEWFSLRAEVATALVPSVVRTPDYLTPQRRRGNLLLDGSFSRALGKPWSLWSWRGNRDVFAVVAGASRSGKTAAVLRSVVDDHALLRQKVAVKPHTLYLLSGWIKTKDVTVVDRRGRMGASLFGGSEASRSLVGTHGWTYVPVVFNSGARKEIELGCRLGHNMSTATGTAWFDDLVLVEIPMAELVHSR